MRTYLMTYLATAVIFFGMDFIWISLSTSAFYKPRLGDLLLDKPNLPVAGLFYLIYVAGIVFFSTIPAIEKNSVLYALLTGAFLGLIAYGTYDITNLATIKNWPVIVSVVDMAWGIFATSIATTAVFFISRYF